MLEVLILGCWLKCCGFSTCTCALQDFAFSSINLAEDMVCVCVCVWYNVE